MNEGKHHILVLVLYHPIFDMPENTRYYEHPSASLGLSQHQLLRGLGTVYFPPWVTNQPQ